VTDDPTPPPAPRPRRRRSDVDPTFQPPKVANERRRSKRVPVEDQTASVVTPEATVPAAASVTEPSAPDPVVPVGAQAASDTPSAPWSLRGSDPAVESRVRHDEVAHEAWLPMLEDRSPNPAICPFLRSVDGDAVRPPIEAPDAANRCAALRETVPQSLRQQELVCLSSGHVNCPRYLRGAVAITELPPPVVRPGRAVTPPILASLVVLAVAFTLSIAFIASRGGLELTPVATPSASASAPVAVVPTPTATVAASPSGETPGPSGTPESTPTPTPVQTAEPTPAPTPSPSSGPTVEPKPTSDRYALLTRCPGTSDCWIYRVRSGDNLFSIARYFGVSLDRIYAMNPWVRTTSLRAGQSLRLPTPTR
jgi:hypothetical protein